MNECVIQLCSASPSLHHYTLYDEHHVLLTYALTIHSDHSHWPFTLIIHSDHSHWPCTLTIHSDHALWPFTLTIHSDHSSWPTLPAEVSRERGAATGFPLQHNNCYYNIMYLVAEVAQNIEYCTGITHRHIAGSVLHRLRQTILHCVLQQYIVMTAQFGWLSADRAIPLVLYSEFIYFTSLGQRNQAHVNSSRQPTPLWFERDSKLQSSTCKSWALPLCYGNQPR